MFCNFCSDHATNYLVILLYNLHQNKFVVIFFLFLKFFVGAFDLAYFEWLFFVCVYIFWLYPGIAPGWGYYFKPTNKPIYTYYYA